MTGHVSAFRASTARAHVSDRSPCSDDPSRRIVTGTVGIHPHLERCRTSSLEPKQSSSAFTFHPAMSDNLSPKRCRSRPFCWMVEEQAPSCLLVLDSSDTMAGSNIGQDSKIYCGGRKCCWGEVGVKWSLRKRKTSMTSTLPRCQNIKRGTCMTGLPCSISGQLCRQDLHCHQRPAE